MGIFIHVPYIYIYTNMYIYIYIRIELVPPPGIYNEMRDKLSTSTVAGSLDFLKYQQSGTLSPQQMALPQLSLFLAFLLVTLLRWLSNPFKSLSDLQL